jgi:hypothetical protein
VPLQENGTLHAILSISLLGKDGSFCGWYMAGIARIRIISLLLLTSCTAVCQHPDTTHSDFHTTGTAFPLPEAPSSQVTASHFSSTSSSQPPTRAQIFQAFQTAAHSPVTEPASAAGNQALQLDLREFFYQQQPGGKDSSRFMEKYLSRAAVSQSHTFHPLSDGTMMRRATYAASSILVKRDDTGKKRLNTSYLLSVLTTAAAHSANRPYWLRSLTQPVSDFGSTIGNDAGMNLFHEFEPGLRSLAKNHTPRFISSIQSKIESKIEGSARK